MGIQSWSRPLVQTASQWDSSQLTSPAGQLEKLGKLPWQPVGAQHFTLGARALNRLSDIAKHLHFKRLADALNQSDTQMHIQWVFQTAFLTLTWISSRLSSSFLELFLLSRPSPRSRASSVVLWVGKVSLDMRPPSAQRQKQATRDETRKTPAQSSYKGMQTHVYCSLQMKNAPQVYDWNNGPCVLLTMNELQYVTVLYMCCFFPWITIESCNCDEPSVLQSLNPVSSFLSAHFHYASTHTRPNKSM